MSGAGGQVLMQSALVYFHQNPYPPRAGVHRHVLELLGGLRDAGFLTTLASSAFTEAGWTAESIRALESEWVHQVRVHQPGPWDYRVARNVARLYRLRRGPLPIRSLARTPPGLRRWFRRTAEEVAPAVIVIVHAWYDALVDHRRFAPALRVIENGDLVSLNAQMWALLQARLPAEPVDPSKVDPRVLDEEFFDRERLSATAEEFAIYDRYDVTVAISADEAGAIARSTRKTRVLHLPMTMKPVPLDNTYDGAACFPTGPNPFNVQGYCYFAERVLPAVLREAPGFALRVTGYCDAGRVRPRPGLSLDGFVPSIAEVYRSAPFAVCPVFGGTGQQVKIVEAMAHGVPVVALRTPASRSPLVHEVNGLVAGDAREFAAHVARLWGDRALCRTLGEAARETVASEFSAVRLRDDLAALMQRGAR
jgi:hypothetical protein